MSSLDLFAKLQDRLPHRLLDDFVRFQELADRLSTPLPYYKKLNELETNIQRAIGESWTNSTLESVNRSLEQVSNYAGSTVGELLAVTSQFERIYTASFGHFDHAKTIELCLEPIARTEAMIHAGILDPGMANHCLRPVEAFSPVASLITQSLETATRIQSTQLVSTLDLLAGLADRMTPNMELFSFSSPYNSLPTTLPRVNVFSRISDAALKETERDDSSIGVDSRVKQSTPFRISDCGARIVDWVFKINLSSERRGGVEVFKPTSLTMRACMILSTRAVETETEFNEVVDHLYFLLYEGSGDAKRLTEKVDGDCLESLWLLKQLRLAARHDVDHGKSKQITEKKMKIGRAFECLIGHPVPRDSEDWSKAQWSLYNRLDEMLSNVIQSF